MRGLFIDVDSCFASDASIDAECDASMAMGIIYVCIYHDLQLFGPTNIRLATKRDPLHPGTTHLLVQIGVAITGIAEHDLPSIEKVTQAVACYVTLAYCDQVRRVELVRVSYAELDGPWGVYDLPPSAMLATMEAPLAA
jgi:hypothetical protein